MVGDILIAIGTGVIQVIVTWYAVHISMKEHRKRNALVIGVLGFVGIGLTVFATIRSGLSQQQLKAEIDRIERNTEQPPKVQVNVPPASVIVQPPPSGKQRAYVMIEEPRISALLNQPLSVSTYCRNKTSTNVPAREVFCGSRFAVVVPDDNGGVSVETQEKQYKDFELSLKPIMHKPGQGPTIFPPEAQWGSAQGSILTDEFLAALNSGKVLVLSMGLPLYRDDFGTHRTESCMWLQPPVDNPQQRIWHQCHVHTGIKY